jgi:hypothetical protein
VGSISAKAWRCLPPCGLFFLLPFAFCSI